MARGNVDLDRSLDDIIKRGKSHNTRGSIKANRGRGVARGVGRGRGGVSRESPRNLSTKSVSAPINRNSRGASAAINRRVGNTGHSQINSRLSGRGEGVTKHGGGLITKRGIPAHASNVRGPVETKMISDVDPKSLVITKAITPRSKPAKKTPSAQSVVINTDLSARKEHKQKSSSQQPSYSGYHLQPTNESYNSNPALYEPPQQPINQKNIVLLCNLDPRATAEDVGEACKIFGPIVYCDILLDPMGRALNEAEIEFTYPNSAEQCVAQLDNSIADGRQLRAILKHSATLALAPRYSERIVSASARVSHSGGYDAPQPQQSPPIAYHQPDNHNRNHSRNEYNDQSSSYFSRYPQEQSSYQRRY